MSAGPPVSALHSHGDTIVELQPGDVAQPQHDARSIRPADALSQFLQVRPGTLTCTHIEREYTVSVRAEAGTLRGSIKSP